MDARRRKAQNAPRLMVAAGPFGLGRSVGAGLWNLVAAGISVSPTALFVQKVPQKITE